MTNPVSRAFEDGPEPQRDKPFKWDLEPIHLREVIRDLNIAHALEDGSAPDTKERTE